MIAKYRRVLVVDDEAMVADATSRVIAAMVPTAEVVTCHSPQKAIELLGQQEFAVLITDLQMPALDGTVVLAEARRTNPHIVSILVTGRATKDGLIRALNEGRVWRCIEKPWDPNDLCEAVKEAIATYEQAVAPAEPKHEPAPAPAPAPPPATVSPRAPKQIVLQKAKKLVLKRPGMHPTARTGLTRADQNWLKNIDKRYRNLTLIKEGGMAAVYRADDSLLGMPVAIKAVSEVFTRDKGALATLCDEARVAMQLSHKHIVRLHNIEHSDGFYYLVMEFIDGCTFRELLEKSGVFPPKMVLQVVDICEDALGYAHRHNVFHRDLKPENIMLTKDGMLKIIDFGLACIAQQSAKSRDSICGTPFYMSPEEIAGDAIDQRADIYSMGILVHEFLIGTLPPHYGEVQEVDALSYIPVVDDAIPEAVRRVLQISFAKNPGERWHSINEFADNFRKAFHLSYTPAQHS